MDAIADYLDMPRIAVYEVASFYSMYETKECGRHCVAICTNVSCMLSGSDKIVEHVERKLGIKLGESTPDGSIFLKKEEECLADKYGFKIVTLGDSILRTSTAGIAVTQTMVSWRRKIIN